MVYLLRWEIGGNREIGTAPYFLTTCCNLTFLGLPTFFFLNSIPSFFSSLIIKPSSPYGWPAFVLFRMPSTILLSSPDFKYDNQFFISSCKNDFLHSIVSPPCLMCPLALDQGYLIWSSKNGHSVKLL